MEHIKTGIVGLFLLVILLVPAVSAQMVSYEKVSYNVGESWIKVSWNETVTTHIYIDGRLLTDNLNGTTKAVNNTIGYYYLSNLNSNSQHSIQLVNATDSSDYKILNIKTLAPSGIVQILFIIGILLCIILLFITDFFKVILVGVLTIVMCLYATSISYNYYGIYFLFWGFIIWSAIMIGLGIYRTYQDDIGWW